LASTIGMLVFVFLVIFEGFWVGFQVKKRLEAKFGVMEPGTRWYAAMRGTQMRRMRLPRPQVKRGQFPSSCCSRAALIRPAQKGPSYTHAVYPCHSVAPASRRCCKSSQVVPPPPEIIPACWRCPFSNCCSSYERWASVAPDTPPALRAYTSD